MKLIVASRECNFPRRHRNQMNFVSRVLFTLVICSLGKSIVGRRIMCNGKSLRFRNRNSHENVKNNSIVDTNRNNMILGKRDWLNAFGLIIFCSFSQISISHKSLCLKHVACFALMRSRKVIGLNKAGLWWTEIEWDEIIWPNFVDDKSHTSKWK